MCWTATVMRMRIRMMSRKMKKKKMMRMIMMSRRMKEKKMMRMRMSRKMKKKMKVMMMRRIMMSAKMREKMMMKLTIKMVVVDDDDVITISGVLPLSYRLKKFKTQGFIQLADLPKCKKNK